MTMKQLITLLFAVVALGANAQQSRVDIKKDVTLSGAQYSAYPGPQKELSKAPAGYTPYYISHYGRHGSRYLIGTNDYDRPYFALKKAGDLGMLTPRGKELLEQVRQIREEAMGRDGELTQRGAEQHKGIAMRMYERFPEVFRGKTNVDAKSTVVIRCILSMENALQQLLLMNPELNITHDASYHDMYYMNQQDTKGAADKKQQELQRKGTASKELREFQAKRNHPDRLMKVIFNNEQYVKDSVNASWLKDKIFNLASNIQSTEIRHKFNLYDLFTEEEIYENWESGNAWWYVAYSNSPLSGGGQGFTQSNLLRKIISEADSCLQYTHPGATLRYGHDTMVMPLVSLLDLNGYGAQIDDLEQLDDRGWFNYRIFPMATNVQFIFYAPDKALKSGKINTNDILVKVLLCEDEATLPVKAWKGNYYKWTDVRSYYLDKMNKYSAGN